MKNENELNKKPDLLSEDELKKAAGGNDLTNEDSGTKIGTGGGSNGVIMVK